MIRLVLYDAIDLALYDWYYMLQFLLQMRMILHDTFPLILHDTDDTWSFTEYMDGLTEGLAHIDDTELYGREIGYVHTWTHMAFASQIGTP